MLSYLFSLSSGNSFQVSKEIVVFISKILQLLPMCAGGTASPSSDSQSDSSLQQNERTSSQSVQSRSQSYFISFINKIVSYLHQLIGEIYVGLEAKNTVKQIDHFDIYPFSHFLDIKKLKKQQIENAFLFLSSVLAISMVLIA